MQREGTTPDSLAGRSSNVTNTVQGEATISGTKPAAGRRRSLIFVPLLGVLISAGGIYLWPGSQSAASETGEVQPSVTPADKAAEDLLGKTEAYLERNPEDGRGWEVVAPVYMQLRRYSTSVTAWRRALQYLGESAQREASLGEALTAEANGTVTADAKAAFARALELDGKTVSARYYLGLAAEQEGQRDQAAKIWRDLLAEAPAEAFWLNDVRDALTRLESQPAQQSVPSLPHIAGSENLPHGHEAAIREMVDRLAARLEQDGSDIEGWGRLVRSYKVLGEPEKANAAEAKARQLLAGDQVKLQKFNTALNDLEGASVPGSALEAAAAAPEGHGNDATMQVLVERLAGRLKSSGSDPEGWLMLVRSYVTLGEKDKVPVAVSDARQALAGSAEKLEQFNQALSHFKIGQ